MCLLHRRWQASRAFADPQLQGRQHPVAPARIAEPPRHRNMPGVFCLLVGTWRPFANFTLVMQARSVLKSTTPKMAEAVKNPTCSPWLCQPSWLPAAGHALLVGRSTSQPALAGRHQDVGRQEVARSCPAVQLPLPPGKEVSQPGQHTLHHNHGGTGEQGACHHPGVWPQTPLCSRAASTRPVSQRYGHLLRLG